MLTQHCHAGKGIETHLGPGRLEAFADHTQGRRATSAGGLDPSQLPTPLFGNGLEHRLNHFGQTVLDRVLMISPPLVELRLHITPGANLVGGHVKPVASQGWSP